MGEDCIFCKIAGKQIPSDIVYEGDNIVAFRDIAPKAPTHLLIVPKKHIEHFAKASDEDKEILDEMMKTAKNLILKHALTEKGYRLVMNGGPAAHVQHLHLHLLGEVGVEREV